MIVSDHSLSNKSTQGHMVIKYMNLNEIFHFLFVFTKKIAKKTTTRKQSDMTENSNDKWECVSNGLTS